MQLPFVVGECGGIDTTYMFVQWQTYGGVHGYPVTLDEITRHWALDPDEPYMYQPPG
jgi:hypothetical protein